MARTPQQRIAGLHERIQTLEAYNLELRLALHDVMPPSRDKQKYCWCDPSHDGFGGHQMKCRAARACFVLDTDRWNGPPLDNLVFDNNDAPRKRLPGAPTR